MNFLRNFMMGRRGTDELNLALVVGAIILSLLSTVVAWFASNAALTIVYIVLQFLGMLLLGISLVRMFSRNIPARERENAAFRRVRVRVCAPFRRAARNFRDRKTFVYIRCPDCRAELRLPKGKGSIIATCPKCRREIKTRT